VLQKVLAGRGHAADEQILVFLRLWVFFATSIIITIIATTLVDKTHIDQLLQEGGRRHLGRVGEEPHPFAILPEATDRFDGARHGLRAHVQCAR